ncbi:hypothetical protein H8356DRAFT_991496 [Neocallimastix lanati (nom. inval.)]|uniref:HMG box domain-containing protein n=1 Tax=Neocallimastix californiae TaxID=1754190 RepID=A0A1Y2ALW7_9FUNG|nr:hypothetical protein H8356DRAFT_991496 [Neocallimastix sp. JGI-2020a]ORY23573.1 hypothetical protein LY90DRAFT_675483 [Neocallimastix californiae]|eukprot:ORY23573.1 hypothetical protein LY90DRAFT_675483 [Neocallimastix californiae]
MADHVRLFLTQNDLGIYADRFIEEGFDNMTSLLDITESDLAELNVKLGHRRRLQRLIAYQKALSYFDPIPINNTPLTPPPLHSQINSHTSSSSINSTTTNSNASNNNNINTPSSNTNSHAQSSVSSINTSLTSPRKKIGRIKQVDINQNPSSANLLLFHQNQIPNQNLLQHQNSIQYPLSFLHHSIPTPVSSSSSSSITNSNNQQNGSFNHHPLFIFTDLMDNSSKRKYKRHPKPDAMAPVKPLSAYVQFCQDVREELKIEYGKEKFEMMSFNEISQEVGQRWRKLDPERKAELEKIAEQKKKEYDEALKAYEQSENFRKYQLYLIAWHAQQRSQGKKTALDEKFDRKRKRNNEKFQEKSNTNQNNSQNSFNNHVQIPHMSYIPTPALSLPINNATPSPLKDNNKLVVSMLSKHHAPYNSLNHITSILSPNPQSSNLTFQPNLQQSLISLKPTITHYDGQVAVRPPSTPIQSSINTTTTNPQSIPLLIDQNPSDLVQNLFQPYVQFPNPINVSSNFSDSTNTLINSHPNYSSFSNQNPISLNPHLFTNPSLISPTSVRNLSINRIRPSSVNFINKSNRKRVKR